MNNKQEKTANIIAFFSAGLAGPLNLKLFVEHFMV